MKASSKIAIFLALMFCIQFSTSVVFAQDNANVSTEKKDTNRPIKDKWALVVGISKYAEPAFNLRYPSKDATDFAATLIEDLNFQSDHVKLLVDEQATRKNILTLLGDSWLPKVAQEDDLVLIYISSHGSPSKIDPAKVNYLVAHDTDVKGLYATGIAMQDLMKRIKDSVKSDRIVIILDSCHSGAVTPAAEAKGLYRAKNVDAQEIAQGTGQLVISSSKPQERSWESKRYKGSVFTKHLIDGLRSLGDSTKLSEVYRYTKTKVEEEVHEDRGVSQTPVLKSLWNGDELMLASVPKDPRPGIRLKTGELKVVVLPRGTTSSTESVEKSSSEEPAKDKAAPVEEKEKIVKKLPKRFRLRMSVRNNVSGLTGKYSGVFEWDEKKLRYKVSWDSGRKGYGHVESLKDNHVVLTSNTRFLLGTFKNKYEGTISGNSVEGTMGGHDAFTSWTGTWKAWWHHDDL